MSTDSGAGTRGVRALFPGQGSQTPGMGRAFALARPEAAAVFDEACDVLGLDMRALCWESAPQELAATHNAQPALVTAAVAAWRVLEAHGVRAAAAAGHSVGAVAALVAAGWLPFSDAVRLVRLRGELMAGAPGRGGMCAVIATGTERADALQTADRHGLDLAADNSPRQCVVSGDLDAVHAFAAELGARTRLLDVSHAFHSRLMAPVAERWKSAVSELRLTAGAPVGLLTTGEFSGDPAEVAADLAATLCAPVRWRELMTAVADERFEPARYAALGPAQALVGLAKHHPSKPRVALLDTPVAVDAFVRRLEVEKA
ncbi:[acyl-carrier-protein] S-malonyltransferase [Catenulispora sp. GP43]|uniref:ACP S-malonyltransferase n=1 Tax=Catenulispora sp. GP43 TaxID=3156263 RepID=UPI003514DB14